MEASWSQQIDWLRELARLRGVGFEMQSGA
jgi:hypothetical protein